jgi:hypothetical protein
MYISKNIYVHDNNIECIVVCHLYVFRCVLVASSDYFEAMISRSGMQEATAGKSFHRRLLYIRILTIYNNYRLDTIELKDITANGLRAVLDFIYTGELTLSIENIGTYNEHFCFDVFVRSSNMTCSIDCFVLIDV